MRRRKQDRSLFAVLLPNSDKLWTDWLKRIDKLLEDDGVIETVGAALEQGWRQSRKRGRPGTPAEVVRRLGPRPPGRNERRRRLGAWA